MLNILTESECFCEMSGRWCDFQIHHMMKECANRVFAALDEEKQAFYLNRFGLWYEQHSQYLHAMDVYRRSKL